MTGFEVHKVPETTRRVIFYLPGKKYTVIWKYDFTITLFPFWQEKFFSVWPPPGWQKHNGEDGFGRKKICGYQSA